jgi:hypothetical protein
LFVHGGFTDEVIDAAVEGFTQHDFPSLAGRQDDIGVVMNRISN